MCISDLYSGGAGPLSLLYSALNQCLLYSPAAIKNAMTFSFNTGGEVVAREGK